MYSQVYGMLKVVSSEKMQVLKGCCHTQPKDTNAHFCLANNMNIEGDNMKIAQTFNIHKGKYQEIERAFS